MIVPAAMHIYEGAELLRRTDEDVVIQKLNELHAAQGTLGQNYGIEDTFADGYLLGLATAEAIREAVKA